MTHRSNSNLLRLKYSRLWKNVWCNDQNYPTLIVEDLRIRLLFLEFYKTFNLKLLDLKVSRTPSKMFFFLKGIVEPLGDDWDFKRFFDAEIKHILYPLELKKIVRSTLGYPDIHMYYRFIFFTYPMIKNDAVTNSFFLGGAKVIADTLASTFRKRFRKPHKKLFGIMANMLQRKDELQDWKIYGFRLVISGPIKAPRNRRHKTLKKTYGTLPINSFRAYVDYHKTILLGKHGTFGLKIWIFKGLKSVIRSGHFLKKIAFSRLKKKGYYVYPENSEKIYRRKYTLMD